MHRFLKEHRAEIEKYCKENDLSTAKVFSSPCAGNKSELALQYFDPEEPSIGLLDETPAPVTLWIRLEKDGALRFEQTEHTRECLAECEQVWA